MTKQEQRSLALSARRAMRAAERASASAAICERLLTLPQLQRAGTVLSYIALYDEVDLSALHEALSVRGVRLAFPVSLSHGLMEVCEPCGWQKGPFGIREPDREHSMPVRPEEIALVLAPCVAFDEKCARLGHGAGYYDRYLPRCPRAAVIAAAFECQKLPAVICEKHDRRMDAVVTEKGIYCQNRPLK